jgi:hypothetical protein
MEQANPPARPALPLFVLLALASALGVAVAIALAGVAMLLAAPAYAEADAASSSGLLLERRGGPAWADRVHAEREESEGVTRVVEAYHNPYGEVLAGLYLCRLPADAVLERLSFAVGDAEARPALLTRRPGGALVEPTAQIGPGETLVVELEYRRRAARRVLALADG